MYHSHSRVTAILAVEFQLHAHPWACFFSYLPIYHGLDQPSSGSFHVPDKRCATFPYDLIAFGFTTDGVT